MVMLDSMEALENVKLGDALVRHLYPRMNAPSAARTVLATLLQTECEMLRDAGRFPPDLMAQVRDLLGDDAI